MAKDIFKRLSAGRPPPTEEAIKQPPAEGDRPKNLPEGRSGERTGADNPRPRTRCSARIHQKTTLLRHGSNENYCVQRDRKAPRPLVLGAPTTRRVPGTAGNTQSLRTFKTPPRQFIGQHARRLDQRISKTPRDSQPTTARPTAYWSSRPTGRQPVRADSRGALLPLEQPDRPRAARGKRERTTSSGPFVRKFVSSFGREGLYIARYALRGKFKENSIYISNT